MGRYRWRHRPAMCCGLLILSLTLFYIAHISLERLSRPDSFYLSDPLFLEVDKCPACYGTSLCDAFRAGNVSFTSYSRYRITDYFNVKNVHYGRLGTQRVLLKRLAHNSELQEWDEALCREAGEAQGCHVAHAIYRTKYAARDKSIHLSTKLLGGVSDMFTCPSERLLDLVERKSRENTGRDLTLEERLQLYTTAAVNPEPLLMQTFPAPVWPFPAYLGSCGRVAVMTDAGRTLDTVYTHSWEQRVDYALQILSMAELLTDNTSGFALYWTDVSYDNFAVDDDGRITAIDLENIIVVDKKRLSKDKPPGWDVPYYAADHPCPIQQDCLAFSRVDLCLRFSSNHNYYSACRSLLSSHAARWGMPGGILHDTPPEVDAVYNVSGLVEACGGQDLRKGYMDVVRRLMKVLRQLKQIH